MRYLSKRLEFLLSYLLNVVSPTVMTKGIGRNRPQSTPIDGIEPPSLVLETSVLPLDEIERWRRSILQPHCCGFQPELAGTILSLVCKQRRDTSASALSDELAAPVHGHPIRLES